MGIATPSGGSISLAMSMGKGISYSVATSLGLQLHLCARRTAEAIDFCRVWCIIGCYDRGGLQDAEVAARAGREG